MTSSRVEGNSMLFLPKHAVIAPIDFSASSAPAIRTAIELADSPGHVHVIFVNPTLNPVSPIGIWGDADVEQQCADKAHRFMDTYLASHEIQDVVTAVEIGQPANRIIEYAEQQNADLIVIPSHGHSGIKRAMLGSVAERVIRHATCPVLVLHRQDAD
jgi:nucleotide-binding universal stress UspA family protein